MTETEIKKQVIRDFEQRLYKMAQCARPVGWHTFREMVSTQNIGLVAQDMLEEMEGKDDE